MRHNEDIKKYFKTREIGEGLTEKVNIKLIPINYVYQISWSHSKNTGTKCCVLGTTSPRLD